MIQKNIKPELDAIFKTFQVFGAAKQVLSEESTEITNATRTSITNSISASTASGEKRQELFSDALVYAMKAGEILLRLQKRLKEDYGRFWRQDLITSSLFAIPEQEIVEAFALFAILKHVEVPTRIIPFRIKDSDSYVKKKATLKVSGEAYIFGLLDCVGELGRIIHDSQNRTEFVVQIFKQMEELYVELERFRKFPNRKDPKIKIKDRANLKHRIDICGSQVTKSRELLGKLGTRIPKHGPYG